MPKNMSEKAPLSGRRAAEIGAQIASLGLITATTFIAGGGFVMAVLGGLIPYALEPAVRGALLSSGRTSATEMIEEEVIAGKKLFGNFSMFLGFYLKKRASRLGRKIEDIGCEALVQATFQGSVLKTSRLSKLQGKGSKASWRLAAEALHQGDAFNAAMCWHIEPFPKEWQSVALTMRDGHRNREEMSFEKALSVSLESYERGAISEDGMLSPDGETLVEKTLRVMRAEDERRLLSETASLTGSTSKALRRKL